MMSDLDQRLLLHVRERGLFRESGLALLAVSSGPDSLALLDLMGVVAPKLGLEIAVAHVDHGIAPDSHGIAKRVAEFAGRCGVGAYQETLGLGPATSETRARTGRYRALRAMQAQLAARYLVTAHHADDQAETILYRVLRGTGTAGLAGILSAGPDGLVRPLLPYTRDELKEWLRFRFPDGGDAVGIHEDPSNSDLRHDRAWLRHRVLPLLRERVASVDRNLILVGEEAGADRAAWRGVLRQLPGLRFQRVNGAVEVARDSLVTYDKVLSGAILRALAREVGCRLGGPAAERLRLFAVESASGRVLELRDGWVAEIVFDRLRIRPASTVTEPPTVAWGGGETGLARWQDWIFSWRPETAGAAERSAAVTWVSRGAGEIRAMRPGERLFPLGGVGHRRVSRVLMEARVPRSERRTYPLVVRGERVVWIPGVCRAADEMPEPGESALRIEARRP